MLLVVYREFLWSDKVAWLILTTKFWLSSRLLWCVNITVLLNVTLEHAISLLKFIFKLRYLTHKYTYSAFRILLHLATNILCFTFLVAPEIIKLRFKCFVFN